MSGPRGEQGWFRVAYRFDFLVMLRSGVAQGIRDVVEGLCTGDSDENRSMSREDEGFVVGRIGDCQGEVVQGIDEKLDETLVRISLSLPLSLSPSLPLILSYSEMSHGA